jgi:hypothetical protein
MLLLLLLLMMVVVVMMMMMMMVMMMMMMMMMTMMTMTMMMMVCAVDTRCQLVQVQHLRLLRLGDLPPQVLGLPRDRTEPALARGLYGPDCAEHHHGPHREQAFLYLLPSQVCLCFLYAAPGYLVCRIRQS